MDLSSKRPAGLSRQAIQRLPNYLQHLRKLKSQGITVASASVIAASLRLNEVQVRKDIAAVSSVPGRPKLGFSVDLLILDLEEFLGYNNVDDAVLVGCGSLGTALLNYKGFEAIGLNIVAAFDADEEKCGTLIGEKQILPMEKLQPLCKRLNIHIGIITAPAEAAQKIAGRHGGIAAFSPYGISRLCASYCPKDILVQNENMAASLALLSKHLKEKLG